MKNKFLTKNLFTLVLLTNSFIPFNSMAQSCGLSGTRSSNIVTYSFSGKMNEAFGTIAAGTPFNGTLVYDYSQSNYSHGQQAYRGDYQYSSLSLTIGGTTITDNGTGVINHYDHGTYDYSSSYGGPTTYPTDLFHVYTYNLSGSLGGLTLATGAGLQLVLQDVSGTAWSGIGLPDEHLTMANLTSGNATFIQLQQAYTSGTMPAMARGNLSVCPPVANCRNVTVQLDNNGNASVSAAQVNNGSTSSVGIQSMTVSPSSFNCSNIGANTVVLTVTDNNGNSSTCSSIVTVQCAAPTLSLTGTYSDLYSYGGNIYNASGSQVTSVTINSAVNGQCSGYDYSWSGGASGNSPSFTTSSLAIGSTDYTLTVSKAGSCPVTKTWRVCINDIMFASNPNKVYVCYQNQTYTPNLNSSAPNTNGFNWIMAHGATLGACTTTPCGGRINKRNDISITPAIDINEGLFLTVYPNPNTGKFYIDVKTTETSKLNISVMDVMGRVVYNKNQEISESASVPVNIESLCEGHYFVKASLNGNTISKRIIVTK